jgi:hypothetical protein
MGMTCNMHGELRNAHRNLLEDSKGREYLA